MLVNRLKKSNIFRNNAGSTLVEMVVCFALLGIFMACASTLIAGIANIYYDVQGETFERQVADIVMGKIESEIDGALFFEENSKNPSISNNNSISLYDKTYTYVTLCRSDDKKLQVKYSAIVYENEGVLDTTKSLNATTWQFDDSVYKGFMIEELYFYKKGDTIDSTVKTNFGLSDNNLDAYGDDVVLVLLHLKSDRYGDYYNKRYVKMYNVPETINQGPASP